MQDEARRATGTDRHFRGFVREDIPAVTALFDAADRADRLYKLADEENIRVTFEGPASSPESMVTVAAFDGVLRGVGKVSPTFHSSARERIYGVMMRIHPSVRQEGLQHIIAQRLVQWAREAEAGREREQAEKVRVRSYVFETQAASIEAWEALGLRKVRTGWTMARPLDQPVDGSPAPLGINLRTYRFPDDNSEALVAFNSAFSDYYDHHPISEAAWEREMGAPYSRPDLSWLAFSEEGISEVVGIAGCQVNEGENKQTDRLEGWIEGIGVVPAFRRRGIGKALLSHCLQSLRDAALEIALADVDSESVAAVRLFESVGFRARSALLQYECSLADLRLQDQ
ncbi:MAG: GNAT family N-acetyltransferase [Chloroflexia bacterium]